MSALVTLFGIAVASALIPVINIEALLVGRGALAPGSGVWLVAGVAAVGQMTGKLVWYYAGANALRWRWIARKVDTPKAQARLGLWRARTRDRPLVAGSLLLVSAFVGLPPFAIIAVVAGQLRMSLALFLIVGTAGRWLRFAVVLGGAQWLAGLLL